MIMMVMMCFLLPPLSWSLFLGVSHSQSTLSGLAQPHIGLLAPPPPPSLGSHRPLDFLYSIGAKATLGVVVVVDGYGDDDEEENGQGENVME